MQRRMQKLFLYLSLYGGTLALILFLTRPHAENDAFTWTKVRYRTTSTTLPETHGLCPGLTDGSKPALVVSRVAADGDSAWLDVLADHYHLCVYTADAPFDPSSKYLQVPKNRGHEAMAYLTFLIDNYAHIPEAGVVFVHGSRWAWHNDLPDYDNLALLGMLNVSAALKPWGYHNLRCDWSASTCPDTVIPQGSLQTSLRAILEPWNARVVSDNVLPHALATIFGGNDHGKADHIGRVFAGRSDAIRAQCCAQFVVAQDRVWRHTRKEYAALRQWLLDGGDMSSEGRQKRVRGAAPPDDRVAGRILSYVWHILFIDQGNFKDLRSASDVHGSVSLKKLNTQACPRADECYCRLYGRCDLKGCATPGQCFGQYRVPKNYRVPDHIKSI